MRATKAVLVTGASSGIGRKVTERLAAEGYFIYAGARRRVDMNALDALSNVQAVRLDVTSQEHIEAAVDTITKAGRGLHGLVNNAGVATLGPIINSNDEEFDLVMAINVRGVYCVTRAFAPLIAGAKGRIVMVGSVAGILAEKNVSIYSMSKHAIEALTDSLAMEIEPLGVHVSIIEPSSMNTDLAKNAIQRVGAGSSIPDLTQYPEPDAAVAAIERALFELTPKRRYLVAANLAIAKTTIMKQIAQLIELNEDNPHTLHRDALISMLDEAIAQVGSRSRSVQ